MGARHCAIQRQWACNELCGGRWRVLVRCGYSPTGHVLKQVYGLVGARFAHCRFAFPVFVGGNKLTPVEVSNPATVIPVKPLVADLPI